MKVDELLERYRAIRHTTAAICKPLEIEDHMVQSMDDVSPPKWHLAHTSWAFETFLLLRIAPEYRSPHPLFTRLFNSYYQSVGEQHPRSLRCLLSRPTLAEVLAYRKHVDVAVADAMKALPNAMGQEAAFLLELGMHHEQQHQELLLMDIKHILWSNPLQPSYRDDLRTPDERGAPLSWLEFPSGIREIGHEGPGFAYDNESPRHPVWLQDFALASRCVTNGEWQEFMADGGYERPELWLSEGWDHVQSQRWQAPLYWQRDEQTWLHFTLSGLRPLRGSDPVAHISFFEADAYARWAGHRLPTEAEWEVAAELVDQSGNFVEDEMLAPRPATSAVSLAQVFGDVWELTASAYRPYPGFAAPAGAIGEYNGKFMINQMVLRGGSCFTPRSHIRKTYRNFFHPDQRWAMQGVRLAR